LRRVNDPLVVRKRVIAHRAEPAVTTTAEISRDNFSKHHLRDDVLITSGAGTEPGLTICLIASVDESPAAPDAILVR
jgi:hypothetical protein